jgi:hypothetical protein
MKVIENEKDIRHDEMRNVIESNRDIIYTFRKRLYYLSAFLETCPKKPYNRLIAEYLDGTGPKIEEKYSFLFSEGN